jgi:Flp pilus assembly protein TadD
VSRTLDALRHHNGISLGPEPATRRSSAEENVLASLGYPAQQSPRTGRSPVFRVLLGIVLVIVVAAILWEVAAMNGLVPQGVFSILFGSSPSRVASIPAQTPPPALLERARPTAPPPAATPEPKAEIAATPVPPTTAAEPVREPAAVVAKAEKPAAPLARTTTRRSRTSAGRAPAARSGSAARRTPAAAPVAVVPVPVAPVVTHSAQPAPPAATGVVSRSASKVPSLYRTETGDVDHFKLALYHHRNGDFENALIQYRAVLETNELNAEAHNNLGLLYFDKGLFDEAIQAFRRATFIDPKYFKAHNNLGLALLRSGKTDAAITEFRWIVGQESRNLEALTNLALALKSADQIEEARETLQRAIAINSRYPAAHYNLGLVYEESGDLVRAIQHYETFLSVAGADNAALGADVRARVQSLKGKLIH